MGDEWDDNAAVSYNSGYNNHYQSQNSGGNAYHGDQDQENSWRGGRTFNNSNRSGGRRENWRNDGPPRRGRGGGGGGGGRDGGGGGGSRGGFNGPSGDCTMIKVPSKMVGRIIGRGGSKISELQSESGARIQVTKETEGEETIVKLFGSPEDVEKATSLIEELTSVQDRGNYQGNYNSNRNGSNQFDRGGSNQFDYQTQQPEEYKAPIVDWRNLLAESDAREKEELAKLPPIRKVFYEEHPEVTQMTDDQVDQFRTDNNNVNVSRTFQSDTSKPIPKPIVTFEHAFHNYPLILEEIAKAGFEKPSPIQTQAWPVLLNGEDLIGIAQTGTGKTLAFLLPAMIHIDGQPVPKEERGGPAVLVMAPTRELALQIDKEVKKYQYRGISAVCLYGGGNRREQVNTVHQGVDIIIATPGRLNDLVMAGHVNVKSITYVVLDEADRMLDMGFEPQIRKVMYAIRPDRQTVMTSATWPPGVRSLAKTYMVDPIQVYVGTLDLAATHTVRQIIQMMPDKDEEKLAIFMEFAHNLQPDEKVIVFCGKKSRADDLASELCMSGVSCQTIHGDREQCDREQALVDITNGTVKILIATDVASRGLDIEDITHVVNYDFPRNIEEYVHRVGRTGRAGKTGESISYFTRGDWAQAKELILILEEAEQFIPDEVYEMAERHEAWKEKRNSDRDQFRVRGGGGGGGRGGGRGGMGGGGRRW